MISYIDIAEKMNKRPEEVLAVIEEMEDKLYFYKKNSQFGFPPPLDSEDAAEIEDRIKEIDKENENKNL